MVESTKGQMFFIRKEDNKQVGVYTLPDFHSFLKIIRMPESKEKVACVYLSKGLLGNHCLGVTFVNTDASRKITICSRFVEFRHLNVIQSTAFSIADFSKTSGSELTCSYLCSKQQKFFVSVITLNFQKSEAELHNCELFTLWQRSEGLLCSYTNYAYSATKCYLIISQLFSTGSEGQADTNHIVMDYFEGRVQANTWRTGRLPFWPNFSSPISGICIGQKLRLVYFCNRMQLVCTDDLLSKQNDLDLRYSMVCLPHRVHSHVDHLTGQLACIKVSSDRKSNV